MALRMPRIVKIEDLHQIAVERSGECLSSTYQGSQTKLLWRCAKGHRWQATPASIKQGRWCPHCASKKDTIELMREVAKERGGKCLSDIYTNSQTKLLWACGKGHQWEAAPKTVKHGAWCPYCSHTCKRTIEEIHHIAAKRGGKCLSDKYINNATKLTWECSEGHQWQAPLNMILRGYWCIRCKSLRLSTIRKQKKRLLKWSISLSQSSHYF